MEKTDKEIKAQLFIIQGYYNRIFSDPSVSNKEIMNWLQDDLNTLQEDVAQYAAESIISTNPAPSGESKEQILNKHLKPLNIGITHTLRTSIYNAMDEYESSRVAELARQIELDKQHAARAIGLLSEEIKRLKRLIELAFDTSMNNIEQPHLRGIRHFGVVWKQFCEDNNLK